MTEFNMQLEATPPPKRRRLESEEADCDRIVRSATFWFNDGSIILHAEKTHFRVHRSLLSAKSNIFSDALAIPQPVDQALVEGCPIFSVYDAAEDWEHLLMVVYYPMELKELHEELPLSYLVSMLRLGTKYQFELIRDTALKRLKVHVPASLPAFDTMFNTPKERTLHEKLEGIPRDHNKLRTWIRGKEFDVLNIALELGIQSVLPVCYYVCAVDIPLTQILDGYPRPDGTIAHLSHEAQRVIILGQSQLRAAITNLTLNVTTHGEIPSVKCRERKECTMERMELLRNVVPKLSTDMRYALNKWSSLDDFHRLCDDCWDYARAAHEADRQKLWEEIPGYFGLPAWKDLKDFVES